MDERGRRGGWRRDGMREVVEVDGGVMGALLSFSLLMLSLSLNLNPQIQIL
jgi:hypothetical protein